MSISKNGDIFRNLQKKCYKCANKEKKTLQGADGADGNWAAEVDSRGFRYSQTGESDILDVPKVVSILRGKYTT